MKEVLPHLREEFVEFMGLSASWPSKRDIRACSPQGFVSDDAYLGIRKGKPNDFASIQEVIAGLFRTESGKNALHEFLKYIYFPIPDDESPLDVAAVTKRLTTCDPPITLHEDKFLHGLFWMMQMFPLVKAVDFCQIVQAARVDDCVRSIYVSRGRKLARDPRLAPTEAVKLTEEVTKLTAEDFATRIRGWAVKSPWIFINAWQPLEWKNTSVGCITGSSLILPVTDDAYEMIRSGQMEAYDIGVDDIVVPSRNLVIQLLSEHPPSKAVPREVNPTRSMRNASIFQACVLARKLRPKNGVRVRLLAPGGDEEGIARLTHSGFSYVGESAGVAKVLPLYEQVVADERYCLDHRTSIFTMFLRRYGRNNEAPPNHL